VQLVVEMSRPFKCGEGLVAPSVIERLGNFIDDAAELAEQSARDLARAGQRVGAHEN
jgi:hypothetical protein